MKVLVIGLGSMGKRRVRNLRALGVHDIYGHERSAKTAAEAIKLYKIKILSTLANLKKHGFDLVVISTPPGHHLRFARLCARNRTPFFVELNLTMKESKAIQTIAKKHRVLALPSDTELFDPDILELGKTVGKGFRGYFLFHLGQNIHDWHPWQKTGEHFIFHPATNGIREMLRVELPWMLRLFGSVKKVSAQSERFATKKYGVDDYMEVELEFMSGARGALVLDLITPEVVKRLDVVSANKRVIWHERANKLEVQYRGGKKTIKDLRAKKTQARYQFPEDAHLGEMAHVLKVVRGKAPPRAIFADELEVLKLVDQIERASKKR